MPVSARYILKRLGYTVMVLFAISIIVFLITQALPGTAATMLLGKFASEKSIAAVQESLNLDQPLYIQYLSWITGVLSGDWGRSYVSHQPVYDMVVPRLFRSMELALLAFLQMAIIGNILGIVAALKRNTIIDTLIAGFTYVGVGIPEFVSSVLLVLLFTQPPLALFPQSGYTPMSEGVVPWLEHLVLPSIAAALIGLTHVMRQSRSGMIDALRSDYVRTARLKGLSERRVLLRHALKNGMLESVTVLGLSIGWLIGSIVVIEEVFAYPGIGRLIIQSIQARDIPVIQMSIILTAFGYAFGNFCADMVYAYLDPRIEYT